MSAADVLDIQASILARLTEPGSKLREMIVRQYNFTQPPDPKRGENIVQNLTTALGNARAFHVDASMTQKIRWAAAKLDETDRFSLEMAPAQVGFVRFQDPLVMRDVREKIMKINLLVWTPATISDQFGPRPVTMFHYFNDLSDPDDYGDELLRSLGREHLLREFGRWQLAGFETVDVHERMGPPYREPTARQTAHLKDLKGEIPSEYTNMLRQFYAFWLLCQQTITTFAEAEIPRPFARRAKKAKLPPRVTVIHLRRRSGAPIGQETSVEWQHRWVVGGHWAWRQCGEDHPFAQPYEKGWRCRVFIDDYVKGPEGKPIKQSIKVYSLDR